MDPQLIGVPVRTICLSLMRTAKAMGILALLDLSLESFCFVFFWTCGYVSK